MKRFEYQGELYTMHDVLPSGEALGVADDGQWVIVPMGDCLVVQS